MGEGHGRLLGRQIHALRHDYLEPFLGERYRGFRRAAAEFLPFMPDRYRAELEALARGARLREDEVVLANTFLDLSRAARCSAVIVTGEATAEGRALLARNLDFPHLGVAHKATIIKVCHSHSPDRHGYVAVGWPGMVGVLSGMNDAGLCIATLVSESQKGVKTGIPHPMMYRRILEECTTPQEALHLVRTCPRTCANNLAVAAPSGAPLVIEFTADQVAVRRPQRGVLVAANSFRSPDLMPRPTPFSERYGLLERLAARSHGRIAVADLERMLRAVQMPEQTLQSIIFEPARRRLYLAAGQVPAAGGTFRVIDCAALLAEK